MTIVSILGLVAAAVLMLIIVTLNRGPMRAWDEAALAKVRRRWSPRDTRSSHKVQTAMRDLTALGGDTLTLLALAAGEAVLAAHHRWEDARLYAMIILGGRLVGLLVKKFARRERPPGNALHLKTFTSSFPSVHTLMSFLNCFAILLVLAGAGGGAALAAAGSLAALVGFTRLYFAVHWPSDVAAGWCAAFAVSVLALHFVGA